MRQRTGKGLASGAYFFHVGAISGRVCITHDDGFAIKQKGRRRSAFESVSRGKDAVSRLRVRRVASRRT